jgi:hypothetical protein
VRTVGGFRAGSWPELSPMLSLAAHTATHVDLVFSGKSMEPDRMIGEAKLLDVGH